MWGLKMLHNLIVLLFSVEYKAKNNRFESVEYTHSFANFLGCF